MKFVPVQSDRTGRGDDDLKREQMERLVREELGKWGSEASVRDSPTGTRANTARSARSSASRLSQGSAASVRPVSSR